MKPDARKDNGGARPGAGRKPVPTRKRTYRLTDEQYAMGQELGGSPWLQDLLNLRIREKAARASEDSADLNKSTEEK